MFSLCTALWVIQSSFLENKLNASAGQVFMAGDGGTLIMCIGLSAVLRRQVPKWLVLIPLGIIGIILFCEPTFIFGNSNYNSIHSSDSSVSWIGVLLTLSAGYVLEHH